MHRAHWVIVALIVIGLYGSAARAADVGPLINPANGHSYYRIDAALTWHDAEAQAVTLGGHLATVNDAAENQWIVDNLFLSGSTNNVWIGGSDAAVEGSFQWASGEEWSFTRWATGEPDDDVALGGNGDFVYIIGQTSGSLVATFWADTNGSFTGLVDGAIVEVIPEPASAAWLLPAALFALRGAARRR